MSDEQRSHGTVAWLPPALVAGSWLWLSAGAVPWWQADPEYRFGWFVPPLAAYFLVRRIAGTEPSPPGPGVVRLAALLCFGASLLVLPIELLRLAPLSWSAVPWAQFGIASALTIGCALLTGGRSFATATLVPLLLLATAVPLPTAVASPVTVGLSEGMAPIVAELLRLSGIPVIVSGTVLHLPGCVLGIEAACSGVRGLQSGFMLAVALGEFFNVRPLRRILLVLFSAGLALLLNIARAWYLGLVGNAAGPSAIEQQHDAVALASFVALAGGLLLTSWLLRTPEPIREAGASGVFRSFRNLPRARTLVAVPLAIACLGYVAANAWYRTARTPGEPLPTFALRVGADGVRSQPVPQSVSSLLNYESGGYAQATLAGGVVAQGYHFFWPAGKETVRQLYHRPDVCMPGAGWEPLGEPRTVEIDVSGRPLPWQLFRYERDGQAVEVAWLALLDGTPLRIEARDRHLQRTVMADLVQRRIVEPSYEVASVVVPETSGSDSDAVLREAVRSMFEVVE